MLKRQNSKENVLIVCFLEGLTIENLLLDDIYSNIYQQGLRKGVKEVPLVFSFEGLIEETNRFTKIRPIAGGVQVTNDDPLPGRSTLAYSAERASDGMKGYVVSGHSFPNTQEQVWQHTKSSDSTYKAGKVGSVGLTYSDASFVPFGDVDGLVCIGLNQWREVIDFRDPYLGETVIMSGITSGNYGGTVTDVRRTARLDPFGYLYDQMFATYICDDGDSGAPIIQSVSDRQCRVVGINSGTISSTKSCFSPASGVYRDLNVRPVVGAVTPF